MKLKNIKVQNFGLIKNFIIIFFNKQDRLFVKLNYIEHEIQFSTFNYMSCCVIAFEKPQK